MNNEKQTIQTTIFEKNYIENINNMNKLNYMRINPSGSSYTHESINPVSKKKLKSSIRGFIWKLLYE